MEWAAEALEDPVSAHDARKPHVDAARPILSTTRQLDTTKTRGAGDRQATGPRSHSGSAFSAEGEAQMLTF
eukprot:scaffold13136_cov63-Phaeocystis_antarctica.AAC.6